MEKNHSFQRSQLFKKNFEFPMGRIPFHKLRFRYVGKGNNKEREREGKKIATRNTIKRLRPFDIGKRV